MQEQRADQRRAVVAILPSTTFPQQEKWALRALFFRGSENMAQVHERERELHREVAGEVAANLPEVEVLAVELAGPERLCVYVDHPHGVDHALCERVTKVLRGYLDRYSLEVSSPGLQRPLRSEAHFADAVGRRVN